VYFTVTFGYIVQKGQECR